MATSTHTAAPATAKPRQTVRQFIATNYEGIAIASIGAALFLNELFNLGWFIQ